MLLVPGGPCPLGLCVGPFARPVVHLGCGNEIPETLWLLPRESQKFVSHSPRGGAATIKASADSVSAGSLLPGSEPAVSGLCPHREEARGACWGLFHKHSDPTRGLHPHGRILPPSKAPPPNAATLGEVRMSTQEWGDGQKLSGHSSRGTRAPARGRGVSGEGRGVTSRETG